MVSLGVIARKIFGSSNDRRIKAHPAAGRGHQRAWKTRCRRCRMSELAARTEQFRTDIANGATLDDLLVPAFATVREAARRVLGMRPFDVQLIGGMVLHDGSIAEMRTGEGKTLVATLPVYLNALAGKGVHVVTVNDYLATPRLRMDGPRLQVPRPHRRRHRARPVRRGARAPPMPATSPTPPTTSSASTICATT